ncbi:MAG: membrane lipoprotein lipid attachment site-containing protein [Elusimicrobiaceae bacterium]|nr:membrane lipoprotein lipid attachment site-containing protein [Elusimicrobiaceae bacterium]
MKKTVSLILLTVALTACAGNPPAWWNPNNRYGTVEENGTVRNTGSKVPAAKTRSVVIKEETIEPLPDSSYEEVTLTPMPDEDDENTTGVSASQNEELTPDNVLPVPSVLE